VSWWDRQLKKFFDGGVRCTDSTNNDLLTFDSSTNEWKNATRASLGTSGSWNPTMGSDVAGLIVTTLLFANYYIPPDGLFLFYGVAAVLEKTSADGSYITVTYPSGLAPHADWDGVRSSGHGWGQPGDTLNDGLTVLHDSSFMRVYSANMTAGAWTVGTSKDMYINGFYKL